MALRIREVGEVWQVRICDGTPTDWTEWNTCYYQSEEAALQRLEGCSKAPGYDDIYFANRFKDEQGNLPEFGEVEWYQLTRYPVYGTCHRADDDEVWEVQFDEQPWCGDWAYCIRGRRFYATKADALFDMEGYEFAKELSGIYIPPEELDKFETDDGEYDFDSGDYPEEWAELMSHETLAHGECPAIEGGTRE